MPTYSVQPIALKDVLVSVNSIGAAASAASAFSAAFSSVMFTPSSSSLTWTGLSNNTVTDVSVATWTADLTFAQDWSSATTFSSFLYDNEGKTYTFVFKPQSGVGPTFTVNCVITPGAVGGSVNSFIEATVSLGCTAKPVRS